MQNGAFSEGYVKMLNIELMPAKKKKNVDKNLFHPLPVSILKQQAEEVCYPYISITNEVKKRD